MFRILSMFIFLISFSIQAGEISLTFDDAPRNDTLLFTGEDRTAKLIASLKKAKVDDVLVFVKTGNINKKTAKRLRAYTDAGFHLANHSHNHYSARRQAVSIYLEDITRAKISLESFKNVLPYYRYPYLHEGKTRKVRDEIRQHIKQLGYENGYVTVDNYDWYMDHLLQKALAAGKNVEYTTLKNVYVEVLWDAIQFYDRIAKESLGRSPKHVLLLHENDLAALFIDELVTHIRSQGWKIISPQEAFNDPIATTIPDVLFNGQGRVAAIARSKGWEKKKLIDKSSNEAFLDQLFLEKKVFR